MSLVYVKKSTDLSEACKIPLRTMAVASEVEMSEVPRPGSQDLPTVSPPHTSLYRTASASMELSSSVTPSLSRRVLIRYRSRTCRL